MELEMVTALREYRALKALLRGEKPPARGRTWRRQRPYATRLAPTRVSASDPILLFLAPKIGIFGGGCAILATVGLVSLQGLGIASDLQPLESFFETFFRGMCGVGTILGSIGLGLYMWTTFRG